LAPDDAAVEEALEGRARVIAKREQKRVADRNERCLTRRRIWRRQIRISDREVV